MTEFKPPKKKGVNLLTLDDIDPASPGFAAAATLHDQILTDLGGADDLSTAEKQIVQRGAMLGAMLADVEARWLKGEPTDVAGYCTAINAQMRALLALGLKRRQRKPKQRILRPNESDRGD